MSAVINGLKNSLKNLQNPEQAAVLQRFFKTGKGEYGEGDKFLGIKVPVLRKAAKKYCDLTLTELKTLIYSKIHEERFMSLLILIEQYKKALTRFPKDKIYQFYLENVSGVNNWDLVDLSAPNIIGSHLFGRDKSLLYSWAVDENLWKRRISIIATLYFIRNEDYFDTLKISRILLKDKEDLIHKAVGWMLREVGNRDKVFLTMFLDKHFQAMPRTMLRYAIEKLDKNMRSHYLSK